MNTTILKTTGASEWREILSGFSVGDSSLSSRLGQVGYRSNNIQDLDSNNSVGALKTLFNLKFVWFTEFYLFSYRLCRIQWVCLWSKQCWIIYWASTDEKRGWPMRSWLGCAIVKWGDVLSSFHALWELLFRTLSVGGLQTVCGRCLWRFAWSRLLRCWGTQEYISSGRICISLESTSMLGKLISKFLPVSCRLTQVGIH